MQGARDPYYILVIIYIFLPYFSNTVVGDPVRGQVLTGYITSIAGILLAITAPILGAIADKNPKRKLWILAMMIVMVPGIWSLWFVVPDGGETAIWLLFILLATINLCFGISEVFHNAMLPTVAPANRIGIVSGLAFASGNLGGLLLMLFVLFSFALPGTVDWSFLPAEPLFGLDKSQHEDARIVGPISAVWMAIFVIPFFLFTPDGQASNVPMMQATRQGIAELLTTLKQLKHYKNIVIFLLARMFYSDGMSGVLFFGGVYASGTFDWGTLELLMFGLSTSVWAMFGAWLGGLLDDKLGSLRTLKTTIAMVTLILILTVTIQPGLVFLVPVKPELLWSLPFFQTLPEFVFLIMYGIFAIFFVTALSSSRVFMARISPPSMATQFFGLYALSGTVTTFLAPLLVAITTGLFNSQTVGFVSLSILMIIGGIMMFWVREEQTQPARNTSP